MKQESEGGGTGPPQIQQWLGSLLYESLILNKVTVLSKILKEELQSAHIMCNKNIFANIILYVV